MTSKQLVSGLVGMLVLGAGVAGAQHERHSGDDATLKIIMRQLGRDMDALNAALWARDLGALEAAATAIAKHPHVSPQERARVQATLGSDFAAFGAADRRVHDAAMRTASAAADQDSDRVLSELGSLQAGCVACHDGFRERLAESTSIDDSALGDTPGSERGARVFAAYCAVCHGPTGKAGAPAAVALDPPPPDLTGPRPAHLRGIPRRTIIENGSPGSAMAAWKGVLSPEDLEAVYAFVHDMHRHMRRGMGSGMGRGKGHGMGHGRGHRNRSHDTDAFTDPERDAIRRAEGAIQALGQTLQQQLMTTMREQGPVAAMSLCATRAQDLTIGVTREEGVAVGRSSLRLRNPENAAPDWVGAWLRDQGAGPAAEAVGSTQIATAADGSEVARVLRPLAVAPPCLTCHGDPADLTPEITAALSKSYPEDRATGYVVGALRGAIWAEAKVDVERP